MHARHSAIFRAALLIAFLVHVLSAQAGDEPLGPDRGWWDEEAVRPATYAGGVRHSTYVTMRDGVRLAVDVHLPVGLASGARLPTILEQTRYYRSVSLKPEAGGGCKPRIGTTVGFMVPRGYAYVAVDVRGTGASFGTRTTEYAGDEVKDGGQIVDWIIRQPWSNGIVGSTGQSYVGTTSELLLLNRHSAVKAVMPTFSGYDFYIEILFPGGIRNKAFARRWSEIIRALDLNEQPEGSQVLGPCPVDGDADGVLLRAAIAEHEANFDIWPLIDKSSFRDDSYEGRGVDDASLHHRQQDIDAANVPLYAVAGWQDSGYALGAIRRFMTSKAAGKRLLIGPWNHGGRFFYGPGVRQPTRSQFNLDAEKLRFFDHYLKGVRNGFAADAPVRYFTTGINRWRAADTWPPKAKLETWCFGVSRALERPCTRSPEDGADTAPGGRATASGELTRWHSTMGPYPVAYPDRAAEDEKLLTYTSAPLPHATEITGEPVVTLFTAVDGNDADFFVYLEEVTTSGEVNYVTEGQLRASHRKTWRAPYRSLSPAHAHLRQDASDVPAGEATRIDIGLFPLSHVFAAGSRIRVAIARCDGEQFESSCTGVATWRVLWRDGLQSKIAMPVVSP